MRSGGMIHHEVVRRLEARDADWLQAHARSGDLSSLNGDLLINPFTILPIRTLVARNPTLTEDQHEFIGAWATAALWKNGMTRLGLEVLEDYLKAGRPFPAPEVLQSLRLSVTANRQRLDPALRREVLEFMADRYWDDLDAVTLDLLYQHLGREEAWAKRLIRHPEAEGNGPLHLRHVRVWEHNTSLMRYTALDTTSYVHPEIRGRIMKSGDGVLIALMSAHADGPEFLHVARGLPGSDGIIPVFYAALPQEKKDALPASIIADWLERMERRDDRLRLQTLILGQNTERPEDTTLPTCIGRRRPPATDP